MYIDSHAHIFFEDYKTEQGDVLKRAQDAGIECIIVPGTNIETSKEAIELSERYDFVYACVGFHPHEASKANDETLRTIEELSKHKKVVAIGEIGLDFHYDFSPREKQIEVFEQQIRIAVGRNLPIVVHTRESMAESIAVVEKAVALNGKWRGNSLDDHSRYPASKGVFHCFTGDAHQARHLLEMGFYVSYPGIVTFKNSPVIETLKTIGYDHILIETDSPYLAPVPLRGKRNEPSNIPLIANKIAEIFHAASEDIARTTRYNTKKLFGIKPTDPPQIVYKLRNSLYLNITIRCNADCVFCDRKGEAVIKGHNLRIEYEPASQEIIQAISDPTKYDEIVFCGYGEPTIRLDVIKEVSNWVKDQGGKVRLNTDGHGNIINKRNIVPELAGLIDGVS
ncbi:MAG: YchF/TatD family DNA exonuclease, partial [Ignavibacteriales bacterium]|nr:YchF/TatD family DNA exonuclease [Ignavibacteriales bacterium]